MRPFCLLSAACVALILSIGPVAQGEETVPGDKRPSVEAQAAQLVRDALEAELVGDNRLRSEKLHYARALAPEYPPARWHSAYVRQQLQWQTLDEAVQTAKADQQLKQYREMRSRLVGYLQGELDLARWCHRNELPDQSRMHWLRVLHIDPQHSAALKALDLVFHEGRLLTKAQKKIAKEQDLKQKRDLKFWTPKIKKWRRAIVGNNLDERSAALRELHKLTDPVAVPALLQVFSQPASSQEQTEALQLELVNVLGRIDDPLAVQAIVHYAVISPSHDVREAATTHLKSKPMHKYVPLLLSSMTMPIEMGVTVGEEEARIVNRYSLFREGPAGYDQETSYASYRRVNVPKYQFIPIYKSRTVRLGYTIPEETVPGYYSSGCSSGAAPRYIGPRTIPSRYVPPTREVYQADEVSMESPYYQLQQQAVYGAAQSDAVTMKATIEEVNRVAEQRNEQIAGVLAETTDVQLSPFPRDWWEWWQDLNDKAPELRLKNLTSDLPNSASLLRAEATGLAHGTPVWTLIGPMSIEEVQAGDHVLSQDPRTGELAYKVVLSVFATEAQPMQRIELVDDSLTLASGHFIWANGRGWSMAHDVKPNDLLHSFSGSQPTEQNDEAVSTEGYHLIVADFHSYFVGAQGLLVHDAAVPQPSNKLVPGLGE